MEINDGKGIFDKFGLIDRSIDRLCGVRVTVRDLAAVGNPIIDVVNALVALKEGLAKEDMERNGPHRAKEEQDGQDHTADGQNL